MLHRCEAMQGASLTSHFVALHMALISEESMESKYKEIEAASAKFTCISPLRSCASLQIAFLHTFLMSSNLPATPFVECVSFAERAMRSPT